MSHEIRADYSEIHLFPPAVEEWVPADHPARFIREFVEALDVGALGFRVRASAEGRPSDAVDVLLKVWVYGYLARIRSTRDLERACREHLSLRWLTGLHGPDHNTLWRFWRDNKTALHEVFRRSVRLALEWGLVGLVVHAVDGTKIAADVAKGKAWHREDVARLREQVDQAIAELERGVEAAEQTAVGDYRLPEGLQDARVLREEITAALARMDAVQEHHLHPTDPDARMMPCEGKKAFGYHVQVVVDQAGGMVVAQDVIARATDNHQLTGMRDEVTEVVGQTAAATVADAGYLSGEELARAEEQGYAVVVNLGKGVNPRGNEHEFHASKFSYDAARDVCVCPRGEDLSLARTRPSRRGEHEIRAYRCRRFRDCPEGKRCCRGRWGRMIEIGPYHDARSRQRLKQRDETVHALLRKRQGIVEPVFGIIKRVMGFRRWTVRAGENVRAQWALVATAFNLRKLDAVWRLRAGAAPA